MSTKRAKHSAADIAKAVEFMRRMCERTPRERAEDFMRRAKDEFDRATRAAIRREPAAIERVDQALAVLTRAREQLEACST